MQEILTEKTISVSEFKKNPAAALRDSNKEPFAVLINNKPGFYVLPPEVYDQILERLWEASVEDELLARASSKSKRIELNPKNL